MPDLSVICQKLPRFGHALLWAAFFLWEHGLSKTKFGSSIGLFITHPTKAILGYFHPQNQGEEK